MSDITKCHGWKMKQDGKVLTSPCPMRTRCYRFISPAGQYQSWFSDYPLKRDGTCEEFWGVPVEIRILGKKKRRGKS